MHEILQDIILIKYVGDGVDDSFNLTYYIDKVSKDQKIILNKLIKRCEDIKQEKDKKIECNENVVTKSELSSEKSEKDDKHEKQLMLSESKPTQEENYEKFEPFMTKFLSLLSEFKPLFENFKKEKGEKFTSSMKNLQLND